MENKKGPSWVPAEIAIMKLCAGKMHVDTIGALIGRSGRSVASKAHKLGICLRLQGKYHQRAKYAHEDVELARTMRERGETINTIAERLEIPASTIKHYVYYERRI